MKNIVAFIVILFLVSCEKDLTIDVPPQNIKLVLNGITGINSPFRVYVGKTAGILQPFTPDLYSVNNAFIQLYENGLLKDTLVYKNQRNLYEAKRNTIAMPGSTYVLKASAPNITAVEAETVTPASIKIQSITRRINARTDANGNSLDEVKIIFADDAAATNYYAFKFRRPYNNGASNISYGPIYCMHSSDKDIDRRNVDPTDFENCIDQEFFMNDKNFNGQIKELILFIQHSELEPVIVSSANRTFNAVVELNNITAQHYKYRKSFDAYRDSEDNPFAEPVLVYSNVKNGYGLFSTYSIARDTIR